MVKYRNVRHGGVVERHAADEWLEASSGWERIEAPADIEAPELLDDDDLAVIADEGDTNERTDTDGRI